MTAIANMAAFHADVLQTYSRHGMNLLDNIGRRNVVMSQAQEKFFSQVLAETYEGVCSDGRTGQPDIKIASLQKELECKLTSFQKGGNISLQTDYETLLKKGSLDYLYVIADHDFRSFAVLHFEGLSADDFRLSSASSRGKASMLKHKAMPKCKVLLGSVVNKNEAEISKIESRLSLLSPRAVATRSKLNKRLEYWRHTPAKYSFCLEEVSPVAK